jgi:hypothetical protein
MLTCRRRQELLQPVELVEQFAKLVDPRNHVVDEGDVLPVGVGPSVPATTRQ